MLNDRIAIFFNYNVEYTLGHYVKNHLDDITNVDVFLPEEMNKLQPKSHKLYLCIDDGSHYLFLQKLKPSAVWLVDTHTGYSASRIMARQFDYVFTAQKNACEKFRQSGINARWLPLGCEPAMHGKKECAKRYDVAFIGGDGWGDRKKLIQKIRDKFPNSYISRANHRDIGHIYSQSKIVFNRSIMNDLNMRVFEGLCSGSCLVTNENASGQADIFQAGKHLVTYSSNEEAIELIEYYLSHDEERERIAFCGMQEVLLKHSYAQRTKEILDFINNNTQKNRTGNFIWIDMMALKVIKHMYKIKFSVLRQT